MSQDNVSIPLTAEFSNIAAFPEVQFGYLRIKVLDLDAMNSETALTVVKVLLKENYKPVVVWSPSKYEPVESEAIIDQFAPSGATLLERLEGESALESCQRVCDRLRKSGNSSHLKSEPTPSH